MKLLKRKGCCGPVLQRYVIVIMAALGLSLVTILRNNLRLALAEMRLESNESTTTKANLSEEDVDLVYPKEKVDKGAKESGVISALPSLAMWISGLMIAFISDYMITHNILNVTNNRKIYAILSNIRPIPFMIGAFYAGFEKSIAVALFKMMMFLKGLAYSSLKAIAVDFNPNYTGLLMELANGLTALGGLLIPSIVNHFVKKNSASVYYWRKYFFFPAAILLCFTLHYAFFAME